MRTFRDFHPVQPAPSGRRIEFAFKGRTYSIYEDGRLWAHAFGRWLKPDVDADGYRIVSLAGAKVKLHHVVLWAFKGSGALGLVARHLDGDPSNNHEANLVWGSQGENWADRKKHGRWHYGEKHRDAKLTQSEVDAIRAEPYHRGITRQLAERHKVSVSLIYKIRAGSIWRENLPDEYRGDTRPFV